MRSVVTIALALSLAACSDDVVIARYATLKDAENAGAVSRGWLPDWLPKSAVEIEEAHDVDTNISALQLTFSPSEDWRPPEECGSVDLPSIPKAKGLDDWPDDVPPRWSTPRHSFMQCEDGKAFLAFSMQSGEMFYWRTNGV